MPDKSLSYMVGHVHHGRMNIEDPKVTPGAQLPLRSGRAETASNATFVTLGGSAA